MFLYPFAARLNPRWIRDPQTCRRTRVWDEYAFQLRSITRWEHAQWLVQYPGVHDFEDQVLAAAVIQAPPLLAGQPWDWDQAPAGLARQVLEKIYSLSGFGGAPDPDVIVPASEYLSSEEANYDLLIVLAFQLDLKTIHQMDSREWHQMVGMAQAVLKFNGVDPDLILDPKKAEMRRKLSVNGVSAAGGLPPPGAKHGEVHQVVTEAESFGSF